MRNDTSCTIDLVRRAIEDQLTYLEDSLEANGVSEHRTTSAATSNRHQQWTYLLIRFIALTSCAERDRGAASLLRAVGYNAVLYVMVNALHTDLRLPGPMVEALSSSAPKQLPRSEGSWPSNGPGSSESRIKSAA